MLVGPHVGLTRGQCALQHESWVEWEEVWNSTGSTHLKLEPFKINSLSIVLGISKSYPNNSRWQYKINNLIKEWLMYMLKIMQITFLTNLSILQWDRKGHLFWEVFSIGGHSLLAKWECLTCNFPQIFYASCNFLGMKSSIPLLVFS